MIAHVVKFTRKNVLVTLACVSLIYGE